MVKEGLDKKLEEWFQKLVRDYEVKTPRSKQLYERALRIFPAGVTYALRHYHPHPAYIARAKGTRVWDVDGNEYIDFWMGHGVHLLGHLHEVVVSAVKQALEVGTHFGFEHTYVLEYSEFLTKVIPGLEFVRFTNSGTEANMYAVRLARAYTGRKYIVKMEGGWHGSYDVLNVAVTYPYTQPESAGIPEEAYKYTIAVPFNNVDALEKTIKQYQPAAVILEPVMGAGGCINPLEGYLKEVKRVTSEHGVLLIFDEVVTGFRLAPGGAVEYYGVKPDIVVLGKALSGGVGSIGAVGGSSELLELVNHKKRPEPHLRVHHAGTYTANVVSVLAGHALVRYLASNRWIYEKANSLWSYFRRKVEEACSEHGVECWSTGDGSLSGIHFTKKKPVNAREAQELRWSRVVERLFHIYSRLHGVLYMSERNVHFLPSLIHSEEEVNSLLEVLRSFLSELTKLTKVG